MLDRRSLLVSAGAGAFMATLPVVAQAARVPGLITYRDRFEHALRIANEYQFAMSWKATMFGFGPESVRSDAELRHHVRSVVYETDNTAMLDRIDAIIAVHQNLTRRFGEDLPAHRDWLLKRGVIPYFCCRDFLATGKVSDMQHVAKLSDGWRLVTTGWEKEI